MLNRFKNKLVNIVGGISNPQTKDNDSPSSPTLPQDVSPFPYARPVFLQLSPDEVQVSADHVSRPILVPRNPAGLPWNSGYAEVINAGKTKVNEDQARAEIFLLPRRNRSVSTEQIVEGEMVQPDKSDPDADALRVHYFAVFDGHAGTGAALMAVNILHLIIQDKLLEVQHLIEAQLSGVLPVLGHQLAFSSPGSPKNASPTSPVTPPFSPLPSAGLLHSPSLPSDSAPIDAGETLSNHDNDPDKCLTNATENMHTDDVVNTTESNEIVTEKLDKSMDSGDSSSVVHSSDGASASVLPSFPNTSIDASAHADVIDDRSDASGVPVDSSLAEQTTDNIVLPGSSPTTSVLPGASSSGSVLPGASSSSSVPPGSSPTGNLPPERSVQNVTTPVNNGIPQPRPGMTLTLDKFSLDNMVEGALEASFFDMDGVIARERRVYRIPGGCTAVAAIFFMGKLYVSNAGDSRAILSIDGKVIPMSYDFTPETDRQRIQMMAWHHPELLCNLFSSVQFAHRVLKKDIGKRVLHRDGWRNCWSFKTVTEDDVKIPLIYGEGKKARLLGTIGVSRGFGDHDLKVYESDVFVKPFMTCKPEVKILDLTKQELTPNDVLIMGTDGLWDVTSNDKAASIVKTCLEQFSPDDPNRYVSAAQELVMHARGVLKTVGWRTSEDKMASGDDITAFVIPLHLHGNGLSPSNSSESTNQNM